MTAIELLAGEPQKGETQKAIQACNDFLRMGVGRTLSALAEKYTESLQNTPPTKSYDTLRDWSRTFNWQSRAAAYDATWEQRKNEERQKVMNYGIALDYERVTKLKRLADFLEEQIFEEDDNGKHPNVWVRDVKRIGYGDTAETVDIEHFNAPLLAQFRGVLDDIAKEVGGRIAKADVTTAGDKLPAPSPIDLSGLSVEQLIALGSGLKED